MSDDPIPTIVITNDGELPFQDYFVLRSCEPAVRGFKFSGHEMASPAPGVLRALANADLLVICPSNPWVSIDPILSLPKINQTIKHKKENGVPVLAVSPIVGGQALKGPLAKMFSEMGFDPSALSVAKHYEDLIEFFILDLIDESLAESIRKLGIEPLCCQTVMRTVSDRRELAEEILSKFY
jgi:LPPG:FO 2-phospho-L-lactate transferase